MGLWYHESCRVYQDRLVSVDDRTWFDNLLAEKMVSDFGMRVEDVVTQQPYIFGDFLSSNMDNRLYVHIEDHEKVKHFVIFLYVNLLFVQYCYKLINNPTCNGYRTMQLV